ncbi:Mammalian cell entry related domain protein [Acidisarcina polymorpha]|uniref:Mammalian cell entry related domain protein n=1 Tax=Acidisarcina polymorpha TaxID=2211140 RepID=A0A2Z5FZQ9_9BACT|nr:MlaD family protein [Acidisarcina polymorpha]AXC12014.1 Mammalian cell entry related domain protein [Acidisarcina polymorpha]
MKPYRAAVAAFVILGTLLFGLGLFLIGDHHKAFGHQMNLYTELANVNGLISGAHVRVSGYEAGQITQIEVPSHPNGKFRLRLHIDDKLKALIRTDSMVTVETDGLVGDKFLLVHNGTDGASAVAEGATLQSREPLELSAIMQKVSGTIDQADATMGDVRARLDNALDAITHTVNNTNGIVTGIREGHGPVGALITDQHITDDLKGTMANTRQATATLEGVSVRASQMVTDLQSRDLVGKADQSMDNIRDASAQIDESSKQLNINLSEALGPDAAGRTAGENLQGTLANVNTATSNMADDTEALKHEFFFRGFFKKRGFYSLEDLTPEDYRNSAYFRVQTKARAWLPEADAFAIDSGGRQVLTGAGRQQIDAFVGQEGATILNSPIVVEGYSKAQSSSDQVIESRERAIQVRDYIEKHFHLSSKSVGMIGLQSTPSVTSGKSSWSGACIVVLAKLK